MATNDNIYKITDINVTAAVIGKPLTMNGTALFANTDGYYGPYAYKATQENAGKKRFKEVVFDPQTFEDITIWHPTSPSDGISGTIQVDPDDNTKYVYKTNKDYALNLALFLIGNQRGDGFTFAVEDNDGVLVEYTLHRDQNNNPKIDKKVDPEEILEEVRSEVIAIATENSLKLNAVIDAVSSNIADGGIKLPMSKLTDEHGQPIDLNSRFILSTDSSNFVLESQATNFIVTDQFKNLLATNLGVSSTVSNIGDEFFRRQISDNTNFTNIITSNINDQLARNTNLNEMIEGIVSTNANIVHTGYLVNLATTNQLSNYAERSAIMEDDHFKDSLFSGNIARTRDLENYASTNLLQDYAAKSNLFVGDKLKDELLGDNVAKTNALTNFVVNTNLFEGGKLKDSLLGDNVAKTTAFSNFVAGTNIFADGKIKDSLLADNVAKTGALTDFVVNTNLFEGGKLKDSLLADNVAKTGALANFVVTTNLLEGGKLKDTFLADNVAKTGALANFVASTNLFTDGRISESLIDSGLMRSSSFTSKLAEGLGLPSTSANIGNEFFRKQINDNPEFGSVISSSISAALTTNQDFERYVGEAVASNQNIVMRTELNAYAQTNTIFEGGKIKDNLLADNVAKTGALVGLVNSTALTAYAQTSSLFTDGKLKDSLLGDNVAKTGALTNFVASTNLFTDGKLKDSLLADNVAKTGAFANFVASTNLFTDGKLKDTLLSDNVAKTGAFANFVASTNLFTDGKLKDSLLADNVAKTGALVDLVNTATLTAYAQTNQLFTGGKIKSDLLGDNVLTTNNTNYFNGGVLKSDKLTLPGNVVKTDSALLSNLVYSTSNVMKNIVYSSNTSFVADAVNSDLIATKLPSDVLKTSNTNYFADGVLKSDKLSLPSGVVMNTDNVLKNIVYNTNTSFVTSAIDSNVISSNLPSNVVKTDSALLSNLVYSTSNVMKNIVYSSNTSFVTNAVSSDFISARLPDNVVRLGNEVLNNIVYTSNTSFVSSNLPNNIVRNTDAVLSNIVYTSNTSFVSSNIPGNVLRTNDSNYFSGGKLVESKMPSSALSTNNSNYFADGVLKSDKLSLPSGVVMNTDNLLKNIVYTSNTSFVSSNLPNNIVRNTDAVLSNIVYTSNTSFVSSNIPGDVLSTNNSNYFSGGRLVEAKMPANTLTTNNTNYFSGGRLIEAKMPANVLTTNNTNFFSGGKLLDSKLPTNALTTNNSNYFVNGEFSAAKMPSSVAMTSNIATEVVNNAPLIANEIANMDYNEFDEFITNEPIDNSLDNLLNIVKDVEIPEIALRSIMSDYSGYAYCTITTTTNESTRLTSWNNVSDEVKRNVVLAVDEINSGGSGDLSAQVNNYVYLLPNNTLKSEMITDEYIPCDDPVGHEIDIYKKNTNGTYTKYTGTVQPNTPYFYKASDAIFVVFECYWVKKDGEDRTCYKLPFNHTITVGTQYLDGTKYKKLGTVAEATSHMSDPTYVSVTRHYLNDGDSAHKGNVNVSGTTYYYYLTVDSTSEPMFSGMSKTYLSQYSNVYKLKMVQQFFDSNDNAIDLLTADISGDGYADLNEEICELHDRATGNEVVDIYSPYNVEYYYVVQRDYNAAVPNATALSLIESTIAHYEALEPGTNYVYLFCYQDAPSMVQYNGNNIDCYALYFRAYARINDKITALNWKPAIPYSIESKQFVYPAIIDLTPYGETNAISTNKNFNTKYPIYFNDFVQVGNTYTNTDNLFIEDGLAMKKVSSWQSGKDHFRKVTGERTTTMTGDEKVDYFLYHKKTLVTPVPDKIIPESLTYNVNIQTTVDEKFALKMTNASNLKTLDGGSYGGYDAVRARAMSLAYILSKYASRDITISGVSTSGAVLQLYEVLALASVLGKYRLSGGETELVLVTTDQYDTNQKIVFYELPSGLETGYYIGRDTIGYTIINDIFAPLGLAKDIRQDTTYRNLYTFKFGENIKALGKVFEWAQMDFETPIQGANPTGFYNALSYVYGLLISKNNIDALVEYYGAYQYGSVNRSKDGLPLLDYFHNLRQFVENKIGSGAFGDLDIVLKLNAKTAFGGTAPSLSVIKNFYVGEFGEDSEWLANEENAKYFANAGLVSDYKTKYEPQVNIPQDPIISFDKQTREFGLVSGTTTKGFYAPNSSYYAGETYAPYTRPSEPSDWATGEYYTKSGNTYTRYTGTWDSATTYYYKIPRHIKNIFDRNTIVRFLVDQKSLAGGTKQRSTIEVRKWNRFTKDWSDMGIEQSMHTTVSTNADVPSYPVPGHEIEGVNDRTFEQYSSVIDELRTEVDGNSTLIANKINQLVNVVNGLVFANLASSTGQSFAEFSTEYTSSLVTPFNYSPTEGVIFDGTTSDIPTPPQYVRHIDTSGAAPATNNVVATNENLEIEQTRAQTGWETRVPQGRTLNL